MSLLSILFRSDPSTRGSIGGIILDATIAEKHDYTSNVTDHPIETGGSISDHKYQNPLEVMMEGEITDSPIALFSVLNGITARRIEAKDQLKAMQRSQSKVAVVTGLEVYSNLVLKDLSFPRDPKTGQRLKFVAVFKEVTFADSEVIGVANKISRETTRSDKKDTVGKKKDLGRVEAQKASSPQADGAAEQSKVVKKGQSILEKFYKDRFGL